ncbi:flavin-containing monooxygenase [Actinopolymorpha rutila]|uniref:Putative flavoprotein involved in K+ transport n=1 Tax=Actinopolymorpha rutila TaxID=446787 RepID=A0A852ZD54_9ACTN|nr:NAD(P)-binding domain-containing protein [Actinopolymorpha rutila]NYH91071.1 putative flavoprotein involved in K+ transport [Actinopolymorpha rutila]
MSNTTEPVVIVGGGQSGLAAARAARDCGLRPLVLEAGDRPAGSWPHYYDSLTVFSPAGYSSMPGMPFGGDPDRYPTRDETVAYLERYAAGLDVEIRTNTTVQSVEAGEHGFTVQTADGRRIDAAGVVAASGSFSRPYVPELPGLEGFGGEVLHVADYRNPKPYAGRRVVVVGGGNSGVQVGYELSEVATVTLATRAPLTFLPQRTRGKDLHYWLRTLGFDDLPPAWLARIVTGPLVLDTGRYQAAFDSGRLDRRPMFATLDGDRIVWADGTRERVDVVLFATGYRPSLEYLRGLGAFDPNGMPVHSGGISLTHPGLVYVGLEFQRSFSSNTLRGASRDADYVMAPLAAHVQGAAAAGSL